MDGFTSSRVNTKVKQHWARRVLGWGTAWEYQVLLTAVWIMLWPRVEWTVSYLLPLTHTHLRKYFLLVSISDRASPDNTTNTS